MKIVIITGLSGSGKSTAVRALEDEGFFCIDNLPVRLFPTFVDLVKKSGDGEKEIALVMDIRSRDFFKGYEQVFKKLEAAGHSVEVLFFDATDEILIRRFSETRRRHPIVDGSVPDGIRLERRELAGLRRLADLVIDTSEMNVHQLRERVISHIRGDAAGREMTVHLQSFGFRYGLPLESDIVMDVRFLPNPYFVPELKAYSGLDENVRNYVAERSETQEFLDRFRSLLEILMPGYRNEGKSYLTISIGCTGGRHRSVSVVEEVREFLLGKRLSVKITHRDIDKG